MAEHCSGWCVCVCVCVCVVCVCVCDLWMGLMQSMNSEYGSPYLAMCHVTFTFLFSIKSCWGHPFGQRPDKMSPQSAFEENIVVSCYSTHSISCSSGTAVSIYCTAPQTFISKKIFRRMWVTKQLLVHFDCVGNTVDQQLFGFPPSSK